MPAVVDSSPLAQCNFHLVQTLDDALEFKRWLGTVHENNTLAFDTETTGLSPYVRGSNVRLAQFGDMRDGWAIPWADWRGLVLEALNQWEGDLVLHHQKFDVNFVEEHSQDVGFRFKRHKIHDTMTQARIINPLGSGALKELADQHVDRRASIGQKMLKQAFDDNKWGWDTVPITFPTFWIYACVDTVITAHLHNKFYPQMAPGAPYDQVYDLEMATSHIVGGMERRGTRVDVEYARKKQEELIEYGQKVRQWGQDTHGISVGSNPQLARIFEYYGSKVQATTMTGLPQVDKYQLALFADPDNGHHPAVQELAQNVLAMRKAEKLAASYFGHIAEDSVDGIIHPSIHPIGARTARMSISQPALQQLPKGDATVRRAFIPREGNMLVTSDYNQIEMRMVGHFSSDEDLIEAFRVADATGSDFFTEMGKAIYHPGFVRSDKRRGLIKNTLYGMCYGAGPDKMAESAGVPVDKMREVIKSIEERYPGIRGFMRTVEDLGKRREMADGEGYIITPIGRRLPCDPGRVYSLTNYMIQSTAADVFKAGLVRLDAAGYGDYFAVPVHDEIVLDLPADYVADSLVEVPNLLADKSMKVAITADADGGMMNWGEKYL